MNTLHSLRLFAALGVAFLASCSSGPEHSAVAHAIAPRSGRGMLVIYRTPGMMGAASKPFIWINTTKMPGQLARGGFYTHEAAPGPNRVIFSWRDHRPTLAENIGAGIFGGVVGVGLNYLGHEKIAADINVRPGQTHFVLMDGTALTEVSKEEGQEALMECRWLNPP